MLMLGGDMHSNERLLVFNLYLGGILSGGILSAIRSWTPLTQDADMYPDGKHSDSQLH